MFAGATNKPNQKASKVAVILLHQFHLGSLKGLTTKSWADLTHILGTRTKAKALQKTHLIATIGKIGFITRTLHVCLHLQTIVDSLRVDYYFDVCLGVSRPIC
jgi:hypothetical protein